MNILLWIIFGGLAGWIATLIVGQAASIGFFGNIIIGIVGAFIGGWIADQMGVEEGTDETQAPTTVESFLWAVVGAVVLLVLINLLF